MNTNAWRSIVSTVEVEEKEMANHLHVYIAIVLVDSCETASFHASTCVSAERVLNSFPIYSNALFAILPLGTYYAIHTSYYSYGWPLILANTDTDTDTCISHSIVLKLKHNNDLEEAYWKWVNDVKPAISASFVKSWYANSNSNKSNDENGNGSTSTSNGGDMNESSEHEDMNKLSCLKLFVSGFFASQMWVRKSDRHTRK